jgi:PAS domain S-box-containing protein
MCRDLFEEAPIMYVITRNQEGVPLIGDCNQLFLSALGYAREEVVGQPLADFYTPASRAALLEGGYQRALSNLLTAEERELVTRDGRVVTTLLRSVAETDVEGQIIGTRAMYTDITERKRTEEALAQERNLLLTLVHNAPDPIYVKDIEGRFVICNMAVARQIGVASPDELVGKTDFDFHTQEMALRYYADERILLQSGRPLLNHKERILDGAGNPIWVLTTKVPLQDIQGQIIGLVGMSHDITDLVRTEEALGRQAARLALLNDVGGKIAAVLELESALETAAYLVQESFGYHHVALFTVDRERGELVMRARAGEFVALFPLDHRIKLGQGLVGWAGEHGETLLADDVRAEPRYANFYPDLIPTQSELCVPVQVGNETVGVLDVQSPQLNAFDQNDVKVMETLAGQIAVAIENARLYEAVRRELAERKRAEERSAAFSALGQRLNSTTSAEEAARIIVEVADQLVGWDASFLFLYSAEEDLMYPVLCVDIIDGQRVDIHNDVVGETPTPTMRRAMKEGGQLILRNQAAEYADMIRFGDESRPSESLMFVPIRNGANTIGVLSIQSYTPMAYDRESLATLQALADHCGGALERIRAEDRLRRFSAELAQSNEELKRFTYTISHDLRAPLVNLKGFAGELASALEVIRSTFHVILPQLDEQHRSAVTMALLADVPEAMGFIDASVTRMDHYINALLKLSRLGRRDLVLEQVDMEALTQTTLVTLAYQIEQRKTRVTVGPLPAVVADRTALEQIMSNLLNNAVIYLEPGRAGEIEISGERNAEETLFHVRDNGRGIAQEDMDKVFAPFRRAGKQDVPGEGMGLAYVQTSVRRHGGRIWCESAPGVGTTFSFTMPHQRIQGDQHD